MTLSSQETLDSIVEEIDNSKALDIQVYDMRDQAYFSDFVVICHGTSSTHMAGISDKVGLRLKKEGQLPLGIEGKGADRWILMDYNSVILHIFSAEAREEFKLEEIFENNPKRETPDQEQG